MSDIAKQDAERALDEAAALIRKAKTGLALQVYHVTTDHNLFVSIHDACCALFKAERLILGIAGEPHTSKRAGSAVA